MNNVFKYAWNWKEFETNPFIYPLQYLATNVISEDIAHKLFPLNYSMLPALIPFITRVINGPFPQSTYVQGLASALSMVLLMLKIRGNTGKNWEIDMTNIAGCSLSQFAGAVGTEHLIGRLLFSSVDPLSPLLLTGLAYVSAVGAYEGYYLTAEQLDSAYPESTFFYQKPSWYFTLMFGALMYTIMP